MAGGLIGYDPARVAVFRRRADEATESLRSARAAAPDDALAAGAQTAVLRAIRTLSDDVIPLLDRIVASSALTGWGATGPPAALVGGSHLARAGDPHRRRWETFVEPDDGMLAHVREMDDDELVEFLETQGDRLGRPRGEPVDLRDEGVRAMLAALGVEIGRRTALRPSFLDEVAAAAPGAPIVAHALRQAPASPDLVMAVARSMLGEPSWRTELHPDLYVSGVDGLLRAIAPDPAACLELLRHDGALAGLASWTGLDVALTRTVVRRGLVDAVVADEQRLHDSYEVLRELTHLANDELDAGFGPGVARGVGDAFLGYVDTLAPAISDVSDQIAIPEAGDDFVLGSYDDLVDLLGAVVVDAEAQAALGRAVGAHLDGAFDRIASTLDSGPAAVSWLAPSTRMSRALGEAIIAEGNEREAAIAAEAARREGLGSVVGFTSGVVGVIAPGGVAPGVSLLIDETAGVLTSPPRSGPEEVADLDLTGAFTREAWLGMTALLVRHPEARRGQQVGSVSARAWQRLEARLDEVESLPTEERKAAIAAFDRHVRQTVPALDAAVVRALDVAGVDDLRRDHSDGDDPG